MGTSSKSKYFLQLFNAVGYFDKLFRGGYPFQNEAGAVFAERRIAETAGQMPIWSVVAPRLTISRMSLLTGMIS
jgi:hypothetical protein